MSDENKKAIELTDEEIAEAKKTTPLTDEEAEKVTGGLIAPIDHGYCSKPAESGREYRSVDCKYNKGGTKDCKCTA